MNTLLTTSSWKTRIQILIGVSLLFGVLCYQFAIKRTIDVRAVYIKQKSNQEMASATAGRIAKLKEQIGLRNPTAKKPLNHGRSEKEAMVTMAGDMGVSINNLAQEATSREGGKEIIYDAYYFSGAFIELLKLLNRIEKESSVNIMSVQFYMENNTSEEQKLTMKIATARIK